MTVSSRAYVSGIAAVLFSSIVWGTTGTAATLAPEVGAAAIGAAAMGVGGLLQAAIASGGILRARAHLGQNWRNLVLGGVAVAIYPLAFYASMRMAGVTIGTVVTIGSAPLLSALIECWFDGARLSRQWLIGAIIGLVGMILISLSYGSIDSGAASDGSTIIGIALGLLGGLTYALYSWTARGLMLRGIASSVAMGATFGIGGFLLMPVLLMTGAPFLASWNNFGVGIYMALVPMFLGYICFGIGLARIPASLATTITLVEPVVAALLAVIIVGERLPAMGWLGVVLVISCLAVISAPARFLTRFSVRHSRKVLARP
ncbi:EamA family transporter [Brucella sp. BE17]|uniref:DMT family transporter n=1 Tax=Brucella sp. BE17 TaxID=3142977 RepID=UPI0031BB6F80